MRLVVQKLSEMVVQLSAENILSFCIIKIIELHQMVRRSPVTFHLLFWVQLVTNLDLQISEVNAINPSFMEFSSKTNVFILKEVKLVNAFWV